MRKWIFLVLAIFLILSCSIVDGVVSSVIIYPDADGYVANYTNTTYTNLHNAPTATTTDSAAANLIVRLRGTLGATNFFDRLVISPLSFNTSNKTLIPAGATILNVTFNVRKDSSVRGVALGIQDISITSGSLTSNNSIGASDYNKFGTTELTNTRVACPASQGYINFSFNTNGRSYVQNALVGTSHTIIYLRDGWHIDNSPPGWVTNGNSECDFTSSDFTGGPSYWPNLNITFDTSTVNTPVTDFSANVTSGLSPLSVGFTDSSTNIPNNWSWYYSNQTVTDILFSPLQNPKINFYGGNYSIKLNASNSAGFNWSNKSLYITSIPVYYKGIGDSVTTATGYGDLNSTGADCYILQMRNNHNSTATAQCTKDGNGKTSAWGLANIGTEYTQGENQVVSILYGANDPQGSLSNYNATGQNLADIYTYINNTGIKPIINIPLLDNGTDDTIRLTSIQNYLTEHNVPYSKLYDAIDSVPLNGLIDSYNVSNMADNLHPNKTGHYLMSEYTWDYFNNILPPTPTTSPTPTPTTSPTPTPTTSPTPTPTTGNITPTPTATPVPPGYWTIFTDNITQSSITWNLSNKASPLTFVSLDGKNLTGFDPNATIIVQSGLIGGETHSISAIANNTTATATATTKISAGDALINLVLDWFPVFIILGLFAFGVWLHWLIFFIGSGVSLYFLYDWIQRYPIQTVGIGNLHFLVYAALFILGLILWLFKRKGR